MPDVAARHTPQSREARKLEAISLRSLIQRSTRHYWDRQGVGYLLVRPIAAGGIVQFGGSLLTFLAGVQLARGLGVAGFGVFGMATAVIGLASVPGELGLSTLVVREVAAASSRGDIGTIFAILRWAERTCYLVSTAIIAVLVAVVLVFLGGTDTQLGRALLFGSAMIPLVALMRIRSGILQGLHFVILSRVPNSLLRPAAFSALLFVGFGLWPQLDVGATLGLNSIAAGLACCVAYLWARSRLPEGLDQSVERERRRQWLSSALPMAAADAMRGIQLQLAVLILGAATDEMQVGLFRIGVSILTVLNTVNLLVIGALSSHLARLHAQNEKLKLQHLMTRAAQALFAGTLVLGLPLIIAGGPLLRLVFGAEFAPAALPLTILVIGQLVNAAFGLNAALLTMTGYERLVTRALVIAVVLMGITVAFLGRSYGATGAAVASVISLLTWNVLTSLDAKRRLGISTLAIGTRWAPF